MRASLVDRAVRAVMTTAALTAALCAALSAGGCNFGNDGGTEGELGNGNFFYDCVGPQDIWCTQYNPDPNVPAFEEPEVPGSFVVGSAFALDFQLERTDDDEGSLAVDVECAVDGFEVDRHFVPTRPGWFAFVAERSDGVVVDVLHVLVSVPARIGIGAGGLNVDEGLELPSPTEIAAIPLGANDEVLYGAFPATWTSSDEAVVEVESSIASGSPATGALARLIPISTGDAVVTVTVAGVSREIAVSATVDEPGEAQ
jgi:hypothetical protein